MATHIILTDQASNVWVESCDLSNRTCSSNAQQPWHIRKRMLRGGLSQGVDVIDVCNGNLRFTVCPTRGMGLLNAACEGLSLGWRSPVRGPVHPSFVELEAQNGLGWVRGFDEMIVRCGLSYNGAPGRDAVRCADGSVQEMQLSLHGRIANIPACDVAVAISDDDHPMLTITGTVVESGLFGPHFQLQTRISTVVGSRCVTIEDRVINCGGAAAELELLYHCNFGVPLLEEGARVQAPWKMVSPRTPHAAADVERFDVYAPPVAGFAEQVYFCELYGDASGETAVLLRNTDATAGVAVHYNTGALPCFTLWKNTAAIEDGYVTGLEPATAYPNPRLFEREKGRVISMPPGSDYVTRMTIEACPDEGSVGRVSDAIAALQGEQTVLAEPDPNLAAR